MVECLSYRASDLHLEEVDVAAVVEEIHTPFYLYSRSQIIDNFTKFSQAVSLLDNLICYSIKANGNLSVIKSIAELGGGADVVSLGEYKRAVKAGIESSKIVFSGVGKQDFEISETLKQGLLQFNIESVSELEMVNKISSRLGKVAPIAFRVNPDIDAGTHEGISTGKADNKFGIPLNEALKIYKYANKLLNVKIVGLDVHIGSQISDLSSFEKTFSHLSKLLKRLKDEKIVINNIDVGGGLGIQYSEIDVVPDIEEYGKIIQRALGDSGCKIIFEPGRYIVGNAGLLVTKVIYKKKGEKKDFIILDCAMNDFSRPALYGANHRIIPLKKKNKFSKRLVDIVGPVCETTDTFLKDHKFEDIGEDEFCAFMDVGAYGAALSSEYNSRPLIPEVMVSGRQFQIVRKRPSFEDMIDREIMPEWK